MSNRMVNLWSNELDRLRAVERAARDLIVNGLVLKNEGLMVREHHDKTDPHYKLCEALEAVSPINPKPAGYP